MLVTCAKSFYAHIQEFNIDSWLPDPQPPITDTINSKWVSRSLVHHTVISREGLGKLYREQCKKLGKQALATLKILIDSFKVEESNSEV